MTLKDFLRESNEEKCSNCNIGGRSLDAYPVTDTKNSKEEHPRKLCSYCALELARNGRLGVDPTRNKEFFKLKSNKGKEKEDWIYRLVDIEDNGMVKVQPKTGPAFTTSEKNLVALSYFDEKKEHSRPK